MRQQEYSFALPEMLWAGRLRNWPRNLAYQYGRSSDTKIEKMCRPIGVEIFLRFFWRLKPPVSNSLARLTTRQAYVFIHLHVNVDAQTNFDASRTLYRSPTWSVLAPRRLGLAYFVSWHGFRCRTGETFQSGRDSVDLFAGFVILSSRSSA